MDFIYIHWTCRNLEEARTISKALLEKRWIACANLIPHVESLYIWNGKLETDVEVKVLFKSHNRHYEEIRLFIEENGSYEVPEITKIYLDGINPSYMKWLSDIFKK